MKTWRDNIKPPLKFHLDKVIKGSASYRDFIELSKDKRTSQLWISNALLSKELHETKLRIKFLEEILISLLESKKNTIKSTKEKKDITDLIKTLRRF